MHCGKRKHLLSLAPPPMKSYKYRVMSKDNGVLSFSVQFINTASQHKETDGDVCDIEQKMLTSLGIQGLPRKQNTPYVCCEKDLYWNKYNYNYIFESLS